MKKQILFLVCFFLAAFASVTKSYGQCVTADALHPTIGVGYDYTVTISGTTGATASNYTFFVTQDVDLTSASLAILPATGATAVFSVTSGTGYAAYNTGGVDAKIGITWLSTAFVSTNPYYLVVKYTETSSVANGSCSVENMRVWRIKPVNSFILAMAGSDVTGDITKANTCPADITTAVITDNGTTATVAYNYGTSSLFYKVTASGSTSTWTPAIQLPALSGSQTYASADWAIPSATPTWNSFGSVAAGAGNYTYSASTAPVSVGGSDIIIRVVINNVTYETLSIQPIVVKVDGQMPGGIDNVKASDCSVEPAWTETGTFTVNPRPAVNDAISDTPNATDFITKSPAN